MREKERESVPGGCERQNDRHLGGNSTSLSVMFSVWNCVGWGWVAEAFVLDAGSFIGSQRRTK